MTTDDAIHRRRGLDLIRVSKALRASRRQTVRLRQELELRDGMIKTLNAKVEEENADERVVKMARSLKAIREQRDGTLATNERIRVELRELWWDLWIAMWQVVAWAESWSEAEAKLQCLSLHGPSCDLSGHWFAPWTRR